MDFAMGWPVLPCVENEYGDLIDFDFNSLTSHQRRRLTGNSVDLVTMAAWWLFTIMNTMKRETPSPGNDQVLLNTQLQGEDEDEDSDLEPDARDALPSPRNIDFGEDGESPHKRAKVKVTHAAEVVDIESTIEEQVTSPAAEEWKGQGSGNCKIKSLGSRRFYWDPRLKSPQVSGGTPYQHRLPRPLIFNLLDQCSSPGYGQRFRIRRVAAFAILVSA